MLVAVMFALCCCGSGGGGAANDDPAAAKAALLQQHNALRTAHGLAAFSELPALSALAQTQAEYEASIGNWSWVDGQGRNVGQRLTAAGLTATSISENDDMAGSEAELWAYWSVDQDALTPILNAQANQIGLGMEIAGGTEYWSVIYASGVPTT
jgi:uncharacterized protein YkwD